MSGQLACSFQCVVHALTCISISVCKVCCQSSPAPPIAVHACYFSFVKSTLRTSSLACNQPTVPTSIIQLIEFLRHRYCSHLLRLTVDLLNADEISQPPSLCRTLLAPVCGPLRTSGLPNPLTSPANQASNTPQPQTDPPSLQNILVSSLRPAKNHQQSPKLPHLACKPRI